MHVGSGVLGRCLGANQCTPRWFGFGKQLLVVPLESEFGPPPPSPKIVKVLCGTYGDSALCFPKDLKRVRDCVAHSYRLALRTQTCHERSNKDDRNGAVDRITIRAIVRPINRFVSEIFLPIVVKEVFYGTAVGVQVPTIPVFVCSSVCALVVAYYQYRFSLFVISVCVGSTGCIMRLALGGLSPGVSCSATFVIASGVYTAQAGNVSSDDLSGGLAKLHHET